MPVLCLFQLFSPLVEMITQWIRNRLRLPSFPDIVQKEPTGVWPAGKKVMNKHCETGAGMKSKETFRQFFPKERKNDRVGAYFKNLVYDPKVFRR